MFWPLPLPIPGSGQMSDELTLLIGKKLLIRVATARQIGGHPSNAPEQSPGGLEQATEASLFRDIPQGRREGEGADFGDV